MIPHRMIYAKSFVQRVVWLAATLLLLCQTAAAALTYSGWQSPPAVSAPSADAAPPCHEADQNHPDGAPAHGCHDRCPARDASLETAQNHIPAMGPQVWSLLTAAAPLPRMAVAMSHTRVVAIATPPPLILLYCRLLN